MKKEIRAMEFSIKGEEVILYSRRRGRRKERRTIMNGQT